MASKLKPKRGSKARAEELNILLDAGEVFFEKPEDGLGTGPGNIKVGDGVTRYVDLPYFIASESISYDIDELKEKTSELEAITTSQDAKIQNLEHDSEEQDGRLDTLEATTAQHTTDIAANSNSISSLQTTVGQQTTDINQNTADIATLKSSSSDYSARIGTLESTTAQQTLDIASNASNISTNASNIAANTNRIIPLKVTSCKGLLENADMLENAYWIRDE